ncbi:MAG: hypothetical protein NW241_05145 [Bacteroidia bacterium]|nr:hypothetical protein [Bacteroidia bacterium]
MQAEHVRTSIRSLVDRIQDEALLAACYEVVRQLAAVQDRLEDAAGDLSDADARPVHTAPLLNLPKPEEQEYAVSIW